MSEMFDLVVIGGGPAGYVGAIRAAQLGMKVACVEKRPTLGGTCLNVGCIPSKALLHSSELYEQAKHSEAHGIIAKDVKIDVAAMIKRKDNVVSELTKGIDFLFKKNKVTRFEGHGIIMGKGEVAIKKESGSPESIKTKNILIATGSEVAELPNVTIDEERIVSSTGALNLKEVPKKLIVIGGGVIGLEMGSVWRRLGAEVEVIEFLDEVIPGNDEEIRKSFRKVLEKQGMKFRLSTKVTGAKADKKGVTLTIEAAVGGNAEEVKADIVLVAIGRKPNTKNLGLKEVGINVDDRGRIATNGHFQTNVAGIYAVGDVIAGPMLAHKAEEDAVAAVEIMAGQKSHVNYDLVPAVIYTHPEVACVGYSEERCKKEGIDYVKGKFPFAANSRAKAVGETEGFVKIIADKKTDKVLGVHILGIQAGTMIAEAVTAMEFGASSEDIARTCHSHPDLNEAVKEAALSVLGRAIHI
ncbi:MAG TPA: dihydrolipoyl dehydrogenase [Alphaproteobacteria bacterium]|nr:dihydrolipoyl dehydrogenase [Alphaproteobacteria bacterium]